MGTLKEMQSTNAQVVKSGQLFEMHATNMTFTEELQKERLLKFIQKKEAQVNVEA